MTFKKISIIILLEITFLFLNITNTDAYVKTGWKLSSKSVTFKWGDRLTSSGSVIRYGWENSISAWNTSSGFNFKPSSTSANELNSFYEYSSTYYGVMHTTYNTKTNIVTKFRGEINAGNTNITKSNVAKSTGVHELGHAIGLDHNNGTSIMNSNRDRTKMHVPQSDDKNGVNSIY